MEDVLAPLLALWDPIFPCYAAIIVLAMIPIYVGSYNSLHQKNVDTMSASDAWLFPVMASCMLFGLYLVFKYLPEYYVSLAISAYFLILGTISIVTSFRLLCERAVFGDKPPAPWTVTVPRVPLLMSEPLTIEFDWLDVVLLCVAVALSAWWHLTKHWIANNIIGMAFAVQGITLLNVGSYLNAVVLLILLFFYDIFWVFGTDVMVSVAKNFDGPIKLLVPKDFFAAEYAFSMLGLGDIVLPGIFLALLLRFDAAQARTKRHFAPIYFNAVFVSYALGLFSTIAVMHVFQSAQPALLYLVPFTIGTSVLVGVVREEFPVLMQYSEEEDSEEAKKERRQIKEAGRAMRLRKRKRAGGKKTKRS